MVQQTIQQYTVEKLQEVYSLSLAQAVQLMDRFGGDAVSIDKMMKKLLSRTRQKTD